MKRNFLTGIAMMVAAFFVGTEIAQAADISFSGQVRTRYENETKTNFKTINGNKYEALDFTATRVRLNAKANINSDTSAFIQMQSVHTWGLANAAHTASDADASVGIHQAYFTLKNFAGLPVSAKVGRQQIVLDGHRLFGHTGWTTGAQTHDAMRFTHSGGNHSLTYAVTNVQELSDTGTENDIYTHVLHNNFQGVLGGSLSAYLVFQDDDCGIIGGASTCGGGSNQWYTIGARQAGKMYGLDYRAEAYLQTGAAGGAQTAIPEGNVASDYGTAHHLAGFTSGATREAYMFGVRVGKSFKNLTWKPKVTLWYDYLSGNNDEDMDEGTWAAFDTLYDTGHKFYGFMDLFLNGQGSATDYFGLQDYAIKIVLKPRDKWTLKADMHHFRTAESIGGNPDLATRRGILSAASTAGNNHAADQYSNAAGSSLGRDHGSAIGNELDITLVHAYNSNTKLVFGYSTFMAETLYHAIKSTTAAANTAHWAYIMADVKF